MSENVYMMQAFACYADEIFSTLHVRAEIHSLSFFEKVKAYLHTGRWTGPRALLLFGVLSRRLG